MFFGIIVRMYFAPGEHPPPHFHAYYNEYRGTVDIRTCEVIDGNLPPGRESLSWRGRNYTKKNSWPTGNS